MKRLDAAAFCATFLIGLCPALPAHSEQRTIESELMVGFPPPPAARVTCRDYPWYGEVAYAYHDQWWTFNNPHQAVSAIGIHGQYIYLDPRAEMVVVKQSSSPDADGGANDANDVDGPLLYQAIAEYLLKRQ